MYLHHSGSSTQSVLHSTKTFLSHTDDSEGSPEHRRPSNGEAAGHRPRILLIGDHPTLQYSRLKVLESAGYAVTLAKGNLVVEELFLRGIKLVLLCHTIPDEAATHIVTALARLAPQIPVLRISLLENTYGDRERIASVPSRPVAMLEAVAAKLAHA